MKSSQGLWAAKPWLGLAAGAALLASPQLGVVRAAELPAPAIGAALKTPTLKVPLGKRVFIPLPDVKRILPDDENVARGYYQNGRGGLEGVTAGTTYVEVYQGNDRRTLYTVLVDASVPAGETAILEPAPGTETPAVAPATITPVTTEPVAAPPLGNNSAPAPSIVPAAATRSNLAVSLRVAPVEDNPLEALFTIYFGNRGTSAAQDVKVRFVLADAITYVTNSATDNGQFDAAARALTWNIGSLAAGSDTRSVSFRVAPIDRPQSFYAVATIEDASQVSVASNTITYGFTKSPLLTVFALPDRILAGRPGVVMADVKDPEAQANIDRLVKMGVVSGREPGLFMPAAETQRAEYAVMTLNGLNLRDLRDVTAIKFVLAQKAKVSLSILNSMGRQVREIARDKDLDAGEHTAVWDGSSNAGYVAPGRYTYVCTAKDSKGQTTTLRGYINVMPQTPLEPIGRPSFVDVKAADWYAGYLAIAEKQNLVKGSYGPNGKIFRPLQPINRVEATAIIVRALGLEDAALKLRNQDSTFLDYQNIPNWAVPYVNIATQLRTTNGKTLVRGVPGNLFMPMKNLRRDEAALLVHRMIDNNRVQRIDISGAVAAGATVTINNQTVMPNPDGQFSLVIVPDNQVSSVAVIDKR
jgi:uncharacterized repeat protein (TIGR01451 family)